MERHLQWNQPRQRQMDSIGFGKLDLSIPIARRFVWEGRARFQAECVFIQSQGNSAHDLVYNMFVEEKHLKGKAKEELMDGVSFELWSRYSLLRRDAFASMILGETECLQDSNRKYITKNDIYHHLLDFIWNSSLLYSDVVRTGYIEPDDKDWTNMLKNVNVEYDEEEDETHWYSNVHAYDGTIQDMKESGSLVKLTFARHLESDLPALKYAKSFGWYVLRKIWFPIWKVQMYLFKLAAEKRYAPDAFAQIALDAHAGGDKVLARYAKMALENELFARELVRKLGGLKASKRNKILKKVAKLSSELLGGDIP
jgi:hypothetical protein